MTCLVLDALFSLIFSHAALQSTQQTAESICYQAASSMWYHAELGVMLISALAAFSGAVVHAPPAITTEPKALQLQQITRYAHWLIGWTFVAGILQAVAYREEPDECKDLASQSDVIVDEEGAFSRERASLMWQLAYTMLWLAWITAVVANAIHARRCGPLLPTAGSSSVAPPDFRSSTDNAGLQQVGGMTQVVGVPQMLGAQSSCQAQMDLEQQVGSQQTVGLPVRDLPFGAVAGSAPSGPQLVAQGMPVPGSGPCGP